MRLLAAMAPLAAAALAERLFLTPPRSRRRAGLPPALAGAEAFAVEAAGATVRGWRLGEGPAVLLVHGWGGRAAQLLSMAEPLLDAGCSVVAFDAPAHGRSSGRRASVVHFAAAIEAVAARTAARAAVAHSMGAAATALAMARGLPLDAAVLVAPARSPEPFLVPFCEALRLPAGVTGAVRRRLEARLGARMDELDAAHLVGAAHVPLLVVHDREDREVAWRDGAAIAASAAEARLLSTSGLGHRRLLRDGSVRREVAAFVVAGLARCACGRLASTADGGSCAGCALADELADRERRRAAIGGRSGARATLRASS